MLGPFTFTFTLEFDEFEKIEKVAAAAADLYQTLINTRTPDGANKPILNIESFFILSKFTQKYPMKKKDLAPDE